MQPIEYNLMKQVKLFFVKRKSSFHSEQSVISCKIRLIEERGILRRDRRDSYETSASYGYYDLLSYVRAWIKTRHGLREIALNFMMTVTRKVRSDSLADIYNNS